LAVKITDEEEFSVSSSTVYRLLKEEGLVAPKPVTDLPAAKAWRHQTRKPDEIWQCDATHYFVVGWGFYKQITVQDDYSRSPLAWDVKRDETAFSISEVVEEALENARHQGHLENGHRPTLLSDNGSGFTSKILAGYLDAHGIKHIFGKPYHPQTQGKIERFHRSIKEKVCLLVYCSPEELKNAVDEAITAYGRTPHTALKNVSPVDVYMGRQQEILTGRAEKKRLTLARRKMHNMGYRKDGV
jgi:transposase InsO family protein